MLKILGRVTSINVRKVLWAADELGLAYEREDWGMPNRDPAVPEFLALNPNALVPVIIDDGFVLWESSAIIRFLSEEHGGAMIPADPRERAVMEQWLAWQGTELPSCWGYAFRALAWHAPGYDDPAQIDASIRRWSAKMEILEGRLAGGTSFVAGVGFTLADIAVGLSVHRWMQTPFDKPPLPSVEDYYLRVKERPAAQNYLGANTP